MRKRGPKLGLDSIWQWMKTEREQLTYVWKGQPRMSKSYTLGLHTYSGTVDQNQDLNTEIYNSRKGSKASVGVIQQCL